MNIADFLVKWAKLRFKGDKATVREMGMDLARLVKSVQRDKGAHGYSFNALLDEVELVLNPPKQPTAKKPTRKKAAAA